MARENIARPDFFVFLGVVVFMPHAAQLLRRGGLTARRPVGLSGFVSICSGLLFAGGETPCEHICMFSYRFAHIERAQGCFLAIGRA